ncbi:SusC/RagA family TonB-linked outer membrane protein [Pedobacter xixiisoli]|uniref:TonB-linked outer membrane protein, SusC/RagA family n=1 Tax=Pedobacter xixiisoli TaxID=1476464 RepID=A0A286ADV8_9SPHI|nr:SusC/RagA family TonB-linked outer membrane protein [Pedobacter xixiisoli]SOD20084.1 TonB-linked outer membrane protein, SusC/RagA family [Pedobacter xixiisoli]
MSKFYISWRVKSRALFLTPILLLLFFTANAQTNRYVITGKVTEDASKSPIPGAGVKVQGTNFAVAANTDGSYSLVANLAPGNYQIAVTFIGYKTSTKQVTLGSNTNVTADFSLAQDAMGLDEVIVTGTSQGTTRKQLGNYITSVKGDDLNKAPSGNVLSSMQGKVAGAQITQNSGDPAGGMSVKLRGISSANSSTEPLYIIDGVIVNNSTTRVTNTTGNYDGANFVGSIGQNRMVDINPADIERVEVLNGASAAAIYGSRANAGVIQIFTKKGVAGKTQVSFNTNFVISELRKKIEVNQSPVKFGGSVDSFTQDVIQTVAPAPGATPVLLTNTTAVTRYDYQDYIFRTGVGTDNNLSISGGGENTKVYTSFGYFNNQGIIKNTDFRKYNFRTNLDQKLNNWASLSAGLNYVKSAANEKPDGNSFFSPMNSVTIIGNFHDIWRRDANGNLMAVGERGRVNPVSVIEDIKQRQEVDRIIANSTLKLNPVKNLTIDFTLGVDNSSQNGTTYIPPYTYNVNPDFFGGGALMTATQNGYTSAATNKALMFNNEINATYQAKISDLLSSVTQVGYSYQYEKGQYALLQGRGLAPKISTINGAATPLPSAEGRTELSISGAYIQQNFKYKDHLFVTGALRMDESSVFGKDNRNQLYVKASLSYVLSSADYWKTTSFSSWWNTFKLRAAYGQSGNLTGIGAYERINAYNGQAFVGNTSLFSPFQLANENVKPERQDELEVGADLGFFNNRLNLSVNYYNKKVKDLLLSQVIAPTEGYTSFLNNIGSLKNTGFEFVLGGTPLKTENFSWTTSAIFNRNRNEAYNIGAMRLLSTNPGAPVAIIDGKPLGVFYGTYFARNADGSLVTNAAGIPQQAKAANGDPLRKVLGDPNPDFNWSFVNDFNYKRFGLRIQLDGVQGGDVWNADWRTRQGVGNGKVAEQEQMGLLPRGYVAGVYAIEEWRIDDGSFVKLREISLSYNIGKVKSISNMTVVLSGRNLISWDNYKGYDPELNSAGQSTILRNIDFGSVPIPRTFSLGLQVKF